MTTLNTSLKKASLSRRLLAFFIDSAITIVLTLPALVTFLRVDKLSFGRNLHELFLYMLAAFMYLLPLLYCLLKDGMGKGQSIGKRITNLQVISLTDCKTCSYRNSADRNGVMTFLNLLPVVGWFIEPIAILSGGQARRLGDKIANTIVVECIG